MSRRAPASRLWPSRGESECRAAPTVVCGVRGVPAAAAKRFRVREQIRPEEERGVVGSKTPAAGYGEMMGGVKDKRGEAPAVTVAFAELEGVSTTES